MTVGFHYQGIYAKAVVDKDVIKHVFINGLELNILPEMIPIIMKEYHKKKALMN